MRQPTLYEVAGDHVQIEKAAVVGHEHVAFARIEIRQSIQSVDVTQVPNGRLDPIGANDALQPSQRFVEGSRLEAFTNEPDLSAFERAQEISAGAEQVEWLGSTPDSRVSGFAS
ncbi:hypothetical protein LVJ94_40935 [Pendulispora rubella]|uniref:Uncharacterized protein n=1 Tax=Pendulispora rubella TaxID=2741070 RepID=A0ABZ2LIQ9_9BACT